ncbi:hypothetical protein J116_020690 [Streptomyces thermolilacinus SPC6]|uniref:Uncharacterized protein n=2 Tax=Streptomyces thermolilacinus TaxID=285540 RepID=A0A1D3DW05_9ACTN|nr:hypothetical protein J116_020690 [Streptomyces thermolilacinus SPC6]
MEGLRLIRNTRPARIVRPMALLSAVATLLAALYLCSGPAGHSAGLGAHSGQDGAAVSAAGHPSARAAVVADPLPFDPAAVVWSRFVCPYDDRDCGLSPPLNPAVLTVPPMDPPLYADGLAPLGPAPGAVRADGTRAPPRAPDLHVLQVLRT